MGVSHPAIRKAIATGRLRRSIGHDARGPFVRDSALAGREWKAGTSKPPNSGGRGNGAAGRTAQPAAGGRLVDVQVRLAGERASALELSNRRKRGELVDAATVQREQFEIARMVRERILNVPDRLPDLAAGQRARLIAELRQALGSMADELERE